MLLHLGQRNIVSKHWQTKTQMINVNVSAISMDSDKYGT